MYSITRNVFFIPSYAIGAKEMEKIDKPLKIEKLSLMGIDKLDLNILSKYKNLNEISIYDNDIEKVKENLKELRDRKIKIMLNGIYEYKE